MKDNDLKSLREYPGFVMGEDENGKIEEAQDKKRGTKQVIPEIPIGPAILLVLVFFVACMSGSRFKEKMEDASPTGSENEMVFVTEAEITQTEALDQKEESSIEETARETEPLQDSSWMEKVFGESDNAVVTTPVKVTALTENEKELLHFRESDFIKSLSGFFLEENIKTSEVTFQGSIPFSSKEASAYEAGIKGMDTKNLIVLFYPQYPGRYQFLLVDKEVIREASLPDQGQTGNRETVQTAPALQNQPPSVEAENTYDAANLEVRAIPRQLYNYLKNPYELQYGLYDYLYENGIRNLSTATVSSFEIDADRRSASITLSIDGGRIIKALYLLDSNTYSFQ